MMLPIAILAGGLATRLQPLTGSTPKSLVEVVGKPFIFHQIELLRRNRVTDIVLCVGHLGEMIEDAVGDGRQFGVHVRTMYDGPQLVGTAGALRRALPLLGDSFFVMYGDSYLDCDFEQVQEAFTASHKQALMTVYRNSNEWDRSNVLFEGGNILLYDKRAPLPEMAHIDYGLGVFRAAALLPYPSNQATDLADVYQDLLGQGQLAGLEVRQRFYEIGSFAGLQETQDYLRTKQQETHDLYPTPS
jgi:NDP-sugar pyrophosphorylase family protein